MFRKGIIALCLLCSVIWGIRWWEARGDGFRLHKIQDELVYDSRWDVAVSQEERELAQKILQKRFRYLAHGFQCYAFESEDGEHVIKFFRYQRLRVPQILMSIPDMPFFSGWRKRRLISLSRRREYLLQACKTSWDHAKEDTGLLYMQLNRVRDSDFPEVTIVDSLGNEYTIRPAEYQFMLQKKALHIKPTISSLMREGNSSAAKKRIDQIFMFLFGCAQRGVYDTDGALIRKNNLGFLGERAMYIDGGKLRFSPGPRSERDFKEELGRLKPLVRWIEEEYPELKEHFLATEEKTVVEYREFLRARREVPSRS